VQFGDRIDLVIASTASSRAIGGSSLPTNDYEEIVLLVGSNSGGRRPTEPDIWCNCSHPIHSADSLPSSVSGYGQVVAAEASFYHCESRVEADWFLTAVDQLTIVNTRRKDGSELRATGACSGYLHRRQQAKDAVLGHAQSPFN